MCLHIERMLLVFLLAGSFSNATTLFQMRDVDCKSLDNTSIEFHECRLRTNNRGVTALYINLTIKYPLNDIQLNMDLYKKTKRYVPFLFNYTADFCKFMIQRRHTILNTLYGMVKKFSTMNHTCPYVGVQILNGFYPQISLLNIPLPNGEFLLNMRLMSEMVKIVESKFYFAFSM